MPAHQYRFASAFFAGLTLLLFLNPSPQPVAYAPDERRILQGSEHTPKPIPPVEPSNTSVEEESGNADVAETILVPGRLHIRQESAHRFHRNHGVNLHYRLDRPPRLHPSIQK